MLNSRLMKRNNDGSKKIRSARQVRLTSVRMKAATNRINNGSGVFNGLDVIYGVNYFKGGPPPPYSCDCPPHGILFVTGDVNSSCSFNGLDISYFVSYLKGGPSLAPCPDCLPAMLKATNPSPALDPNMDQSAK